MFNKRKHRLFLFARPEITRPTNRVGLATQRTALDMPKRLNGILVSRTTSIMACMSIIKIFFFFFCTKTTKRIGLWVYTNDVVTWTSKTRIFGKSNRWRAPGNKLSARVRCKNEKTSSAKNLWPGSDTRCTSRRRCERFDCAFRYWPSEEATFSESSPSNCRVVSNRVRCRILEKT